MFRNVYILETISYSNHYAKFKTGLIDGIIGIIEKSAAPSHPVEIKIVKIVINLNKEFLYIIWIPMFCFN